MPKILAIDYGTKNIGLALSDDEGKIAFPYKTLKPGCHSRESGNPENLFCDKPRFIDPRLRGDDKKRNRITEKIISDLKNICKIEKVEKIIIGMPLFLTGDKSKTTEKVFDFARALEREIGLPVETIDERLSTIQAKKLENKNARNIDELSAQILLQGYLD